jgi:hypothetical protein
MTTNVFFAELSADALTAGRLFDGLAAGSFIDMHGRRSRSRRTSCPSTWLTLWRPSRPRGPRAAKSSGLPIDARDHENGDGSGWIVGAELEGNRIRLMPKWTDLGLDLVKRGIQRFFSATVDTGQQGHPGRHADQLAGHARSAGQGHAAAHRAVGATAYQLADDAEDSLNDKLQDVYDAWHAQYEPPEPLPYCRIVEV